MDLRKKKKKKDATRGHYFVTQAKRLEGEKTLRTSPPGRLLVVQAEPASHYWLYFLPARSHRHLSTCRCDCRFNPERGRAPVSPPPRLERGKGRGALLLIPSGTANAMRKDRSCSVRVDCDVAVSTATDFFLFFFPLLFSS